MCYPEVRKEVVSFIYQIWIIYRFQSAGRRGPGRTNYGWKKRKIASWVDVDESKCWWAACCSAYIFVLNDMPILSGSRLLMAFVKQWELTPHLCKRCGVCINTQKNCRHSGWTSLTRVLCFHSKHGLQPHLMSLLCERKMAFIEVCRSSLRRERETRKMSHLISTWEQLQPWQWLSFGRRISFL